MTTIRLDFRQHTMLLGSARDQHREHAYPIAIIVAQSALESRVRQSFEALLIAAGRDPASDAPPDRSFMRDTTRDLWRSLTGDRISRATAWKRYHDHVERRNEVAHGNKDWPGRAASRDSINAVEGLIAHIEHVEMQVLGRLAI